MSFRRGSRTSRRKKVTTSAPEPVSVQVAPEPIPLDPLTIYRNLQRPAELGRLPGLGVRLAEAEEQPLQYDNPQPPGHLRRLQPPKDQQS